MLINYRKGLFVVFSLILVEQETAKMVRVRFKGGS